MDTTTTGNFTKTLFQVLHLEWNHSAEARDLLSSIIIEEECIYTIMEDVVFSMSQFLKYVREDKGIESGDDDMVPYFIKKEDFYIFHIGNSKSSKIAFVIQIDADNEEFVFRQSEGNESQEDRCQDLEQIKSILFVYFSSFYDNFYGEKA